MPEQIKKSKQTRDTTEKTVEPAVASHSKSQILTSQLDDLLDEIDEVLESNAEEFVKSYVQKGGQ